jgi:hypothetical protein
MAITMAWGGTYTVLLEVGFIVREFTLNTSTLDGSDVLDGTLEGIDATEWVQEISINRGRSDILQDFTAGRCVIVLNNNDRRFDPLNASSPYVDPSTGESGVVPRRKVTVKYGSTTLFTGRITDIDFEYEPTPVTRSTCTIEASDDFLRLASTYISAHTPTSALSGAAVSAILDRAEVNYPSTRSISTGTATIGAYPIAESTNTLDYLLDVSRTEQGYLFIKGNGDLNFTDRVTASFASPTFTFTDSGSGVGYSDFGVQYGDEFLYNRILVENATGTTVNADDATSQTTYGISALRLGECLFASDAAAQSLADFLLNEYKEPEYRIDEIKVDFAGANVSTANQQSIVDLDLGGVIAVVKSFSTGTPSSVSQNLAIQQINHSISPLAHSINFRLSPARVLGQFTLNSATLGTLDDNNAVT